jgi:hypothetical protein
MLSVGIRDGKIVTELDQWMQAQNPHHDGMDRLRDLGEAEWGGTKYPEIRLYGAALNNWNLRALVEKVADLPWLDPHLVQLFICGQEDATFGVWMFSEGGFREVVPPRTYVGERAPFNAIWEHNNPAV